jgi:PAS domain S-box-containing protein
MTNRSEHVVDQLAAWARSPRGGALLAAVLTLAVLLPIWLLGIGWYRTELLRAEPGQRTLLIFEVGGLIVMALFAGLVYLSVNRQALLSQAVHERIREITRSNQQLEEDLAERQKIEEELRRSDERYRALARSFPNGAVFLFDADLRYTLADGAGLADVGLTKEMLEGLTIWEALPPDTIEIVEPHYRAAWAGEPHVFEAAFGGHLYLSRTLPLRDDRGAIIAGLAVTQDITERQRAEQSLHRWAHIFEHAEWGVAIGSADGRSLEMMNPAYAKMHGFTVEELAGLPIASVYAPGAAAELSALIRTANETGHAVIESTHVRKDGSTFPVLVDLTAVKDERGQLLYRVANVQDITDRKRAEDELRANEARLQVLIEQMPALLWTMDRELRFTSSSGAGMATLGLQPQDVIGRSLQDFAVPNDAEFAKIMEMHQRALHGESVSYESLRRGRSIQNHLEPLRAANGDIIGCIGVGLDITEQKQSEAALRRSQQQYEQLVNSIDGIVWEGDAQTGLFTFVSPAAERILGYPIESWLTESTFWIDRLHPDDREWVVDYCASATAARRPHECEYRMLAADGRNVWLRETVSVTAENNQPKLLRGMMIDITERKHVEEALREREEQYRSIFEASLDGLFINSLDGYIIDVNPAGARMHGYTVDECRGLRSEQFVPPDRLPGLEEFIDRARTGGQYRSSGFDQRRDGSIFPVDIVGTQFIYRGQPHALAIVRDNTETMQTEQALQERELQYRSIFESSLDGLAINNLDGQLVEFNPAMAHMHGYTIEEFRQIQPGQFIHPASQPLFVDYMHTVRSGREYRCRAIDVRKDGSTFYVDVVGTPFTLRGQPHAFAIVRDISAQVEAEEALEQRVTERTRELSTLLDVSRNIASTLEIEPLLGLILDALKVFVDYTGARIYTLEGQMLRVRAARGLNRADRAIGTEFPLSGLLSEEVFIRRRVLVIPDLDAQDDPWAVAFREEGPTNIADILTRVRSWMGVPLIARERVIGNLALEHGQPGFYDAHQAEVVLALADQVAVALENARLFTEAQGKAVLEERQRLARDLHDSVTQSLYSLTLLAEASRRLIEADVSQAARYLSDIGEIAQQSLKEMRLLVYQLRPLALEHEGLIGAVQARLDSVEKRAGIEARFLIEGNLSRLPPAIEEGLFRIAQEALNNALKHAAARSVVVRLRGEDECVTLEVADDGRGSALLTTDVRGGLGLTSIKERVAQLQGTLTLDSAPGEGTRITVEVPRSIPSATPGR